MANRKYLQQNKNNWNGKLGKWVTLQTFWGIYISQSYEFLSLPTSLVELLSWLRFATQHQEFVDSWSLEALVLASDDSRCTLIANVRFAECLLAIR